MLQKMYTVPHWIAVIRMFGYQAIQMEEARAKIKPVADEFGKEPVAQACETLVEIFNEGKEPHARLKAHIRRMAFQILGPESPVDPTITPEGVSKSESSSRRHRAERKPRKSGQESAPQPAEKQNARPQTDSPIMQQYREAKEKHPDMILLFRNVAK